MDYEGICAFANGAVSVNAHSSVRIALPAGGAAYFDPFMLAGSAGANAGDAEVIFFTHNHYDHFSPEDFAGLVNGQTRFVMPRSMVTEALAADAGIAAERIVPLEPGQAAVLSCANAEMPVEAFASYNVSKKFHPRANGWLGYVVEIGGVRLCVAGDTDATEELAQVSCDVLLLPVGGKFTMNAPEAAALVARMHRLPALAVPTHFGSITGKSTDGAAFARKLGSLAPAVRVQLPSFAV